MSICWNVVAFCVAVLLSGCVGDNPDYCDESKPCPSGYICEPRLHGCVPIPDGGADAKVDGQGQDPDGQPADGSGQKKNGASCAKDGECTSGFCVDGVCCDGKCDSTCKSCAVSGKLGTCSYVPSGSDLRKDCTGASSACAGACDGLGGCLYPGSETSCGADACSAGKLTIQQCDGSGGCGSSLEDCGGYACASTTACKTSCTTKSDCTGSFTCVNTKCTNNLADGEACGTNNDACKSKKCVDGVCCATDCTGTCMACDVKGKEGTCSAVPSGQDPDLECTGKDALCSGACDGGGKCSFPGATKQCQAAACSGSTLTKHACDGKGTCGSASSSCGNYTCNAAKTACRTSCTSNSHCVPKLCDLHTSKNTCPAASSICYVDAKVSGGNGSLATPYDTITKCLATTNAYVSVADGTYAENLTISGKKVQIVAVTEPSSVFAGGIPSVSLRPTNLVDAGIYIKNKADFVLRGVDVSTKVANVDLLTAEDAVVSIGSCRFHDSPGPANCISISSSTVSVSDSAISNCNNSGIVTSNCNLSLSQVQSNNNSAEGILFDDMGGSNSFIGDQITASNNGYSGIAISLTDKTTLNRIIVQGNGVCGIGMGAASGVWITNLLSTGNKVGVIWTGASCSTCSSSGISNATVAFNKSYEFDCSHSTGYQKLNVVNSIAWDTSGTALNDIGCVFTYSDVHGGATGTTNINTDPYFVDSSKGNYRLSNTRSKKSPCINAGDPASKNMPSTDLDGATRLNGVVDMGAYEAK